MLPALASTTKILIWGLGIVVALNNAGYDVGALLAGIGIGGLAMAMAAKDTVANIFGGIPVYADKPFVIGDRVKVDGYDGSVISIGIRSTRIKTLDGAVVVIPNHLFTEKVVTNVTVGVSRRIRHEMGLVYQTGPEGLRRAMRILEEIVASHAEDLTSEHVIAFTGFGEYALQLLFVYHVRQERDLAAAQTKVHLAVLERFAAEGIEFAYPTAVELQGEHKPPVAPGT